MLAALGDPSVGLGQVLALRNMAISWPSSQRVRSTGLAHLLGTVGTYDDAVIESFWGRISVEFLNRKHSSKRVEVSSAIFDWIGVCYNPTLCNPILGQSVSGCL